MSYFDDASLVMIPSGYKDQKVYSVKPTDGTGDLTFSRGSDIEATRVAANGYIEKAKVNLLLQSNTFDTTWTADASITLTSGQTGYDGTANAWLFSKGALTYQKIYQNITASGICTLSVYAKAGTSSQLTLRDGSSQGRVEFNLSTGSVDDIRTENIVAYDISSVGNGWYRCQVSFNGIASLIQLYIDFVETDAGNIYIQDAQLNYGLVAQDYVETTTTSVVSGITNDLPRLDYSGGASCPSLLLEPSRQNLVAFSEYLNGSIWIQNACSVTDNDTTSPEGVINAAKVEGDGTDTQIRLYDNYTFPATGDYVLSVFAKAGNNDFIALAYKGVGGGLTAYFDLSEGTTSDTTNGTIEAVGSDGWYRCSLKSNLTGPDLIGNYNLYVAKDLTTTTFPSNGDANGQYVHAYGFQLEAGSYPTSYIPTYGTSATRTADAAYKTGLSSVFNDSEGVLFAELSTFDDVGTKVITISDGTTSNRVQLYYFGGVIRGAVAGQAVISHSVTATDTIKVAFKYKVNDFALWVDGVEVGTDTSGSAPSGLNKISFDNGASASLFEGNLNQLIYFPTALSDTELATLTA